MARADARVGLRTQRFELGRGVGVQGHRALPREDGGDGGKRELIAGSRRRASRAIPAGRVVELIDCSVIGLERNLGSP
jgi:hypothetical protein